VPGRPKVVGDDCCAESGRKGEATVAGIAGRSCGPCVRAEDRGRSCDATQPSGRDVS
jgi:hypothetical protein